MVDILNPSAKPHTSLPSRHLILVGGLLGAKKPFLLSLSIYCHKHDIFVHLQGGCLSKS